MWNKNIMGRGEGSKVTVKDDYKVAMMRMVGH